MDNEQSLAPNTELLYLLGGMNEKLDGVVREQVVARTDAAAFRVEVRGDVETLRGEVAGVKTDVSVLQSQRVPKTPWYYVVGGFSGIGAIITVIVTYFLKP